MNAYLKLIEKTLTKRLPFDPFDPLYCYYNLLKAPNGYTIVRKFTDLQYTLNKPFFITAAQCEELLNTICIIQRQYWALSRFATICRNKIILKTNIGLVPVAINVDLYMNDIDPSMKNVIVIRQNAKDYYFTIRDLMNIINKNLANSNSFFPKPLPIKNPYNNMKFTHTQLYNIYFAVRESHYVMPELFQGFFRCNFAIKEFCMRYESNMRTIAIRNYVYNAHYDTLYSHVILLFYHHSLQLYDNIHDDFPKDTLVKIFRPFIYLYLMGNYGIKDTLIVENAIDQLNEKIKAFTDFNPTFGRRFIKCKVIDGKWMKKMTFNDRHLNFDDL